MPKPTFVLSLGGSLIAPASGPDIAYLGAVKSFLLNQIKHGRRFLVVAGGGQTARAYLSAARALGQSSNTQLDWLGIAATRLNAELLKNIFRPVCAEEIITDPTAPLGSRKNLLIAGGWKPGASTDHVAVRLAENISARIIINLSNIDYVFDQDPKRSAAAKPLANLAWPELTGLIGKKWRPGANLPFDPIAAQRAAAKKMTAIIANGRDFKNLADILDGKKFISTIIS